MRVSTEMIFTAGLTSIQKQAASLLNVQQQVASGRRILTPADDPVAAARVLEVTQSKEINLQFNENQKTADEFLGQEESQIAGAESLLVRVRELAIQSGDAALSDANRRSIGTELRQIFDQMLSISNTTDGSGQYIFSGFQGTTKPFSGTVSGGVSYAGDDGQRLLQIAASRLIPVSDSGNDVFVNIRNGNSYFVTDANAANTGTGIIDSGQVVNPTTPITEDYTISFTMVGTTLTYNVTGSVSGAITSAAYTSGAPITFANVTATIEGTPAVGDSFTVTRSSSQSVFTTLGNLITAVETPTSLTNGNTLLANRLGTALTDIQQAQDNFLRIRSEIGARQIEIQNLSSLGEDLNLQYESSLSRLQDVDYAAAISQLTREQLYLEAAQQSYVRVTGLTVFNFL